MEVDGIDNVQDSSSNWALVKSKWLETERETQKQNRPQIMIIAAKEDKSYVNILLKINTNAAVFSQNLR